MTTPVGDGAQSGAEGTQSGAGEATGTGGTTQQDGTTAQSGGEAQVTQTAADTVSRADLDAVRTRMQAADQRAAKAEQELRQIRDKDLPEAEKLKRDFEASQTQVTQLQETNKALALKVAFLSDNTYAWHNPERALKLVDLSQVEIEDDGSVRGLKDALKALATSDDYLIKKEVKEEPKPQGGTAPGNNGQTPAPSTTTRPLKGGTW
jgi:hypothetical protein